MFNEAEVFRMFTSGEPLIPKGSDPWQGAHVWTFDHALKKIQDALQALGNTSGSVARRLALMKCKGERGNPCGCPITNYLRRQRIGNFSLTLTGGWLDVMARDGWLESFRVPPAVEWFVMRFDRGEYPDAASDTSGPGAGYVPPDWNALHAADTAAA